MALEKGPGRRVAEGCIRQLREAAAMTKVFRKVWLPIAIMVALTVGVLTVSHLRTIFGAHPVLVTLIGADTAEKFNPKVVTYEVFGSGSTAVINYKDLDGIPAAHRDRPAAMDLDVDDHGALVVSERPGPDRRPEHRLPDHRR